MLAIGRGHTTWTEIPDAPTPTGSLSLVGRGSAASAASSADASAQAITAHDTTPIFSAGAALPQSGAPLLLSPVASVVTELQSPTSVQRGGGEPPSSGGGGGEIGRGEELAPMSLALADASDHGWFIVPSAANEYGESYATAGDGFEWNVAAGEFSADWFFV